MLEVNMLAPVFRRLLGIHLVLYLLIVLGLIVLSSSADAEFVRSFQFDVVGRLPSAEHKIVFANNTGLREEDLYAVSGGLLRQRTFRIDQGNSSYLYPNINDVDGQLDHAQDFMMEARLQVLAIQGRGGAYFQAFDGVNGYRALFTPIGVALSTNIGDINIPADVFQFHSYRLESPANSNALRFYVDEVLRFEGTAEPTTTLNGFGWGDGITARGNSADVDWDYLRISNAPVPEPSTLTLLGVGAVSLLGYGWRHFRKGKGVGGFLE
ncbi:MAG: PEP-CTERM sorting domain-containing protein [Gemmataceae bacterium]|nr:PEP-CTERM sorting domain-containing protein [Gemmataceae bacterium]